MNAQAGTCVWYTSTVHKCHMHACTHAVWPQYSTTISSSGTKFIATYVEIWLKMWLSLCAWHFCLIYFVSQCIDALIERRYPAVDIPTLLFSFKNLFMEILHCVLSVAGQLVVIVIDQEHDNCTNIIVL